MNSIKKIYIPTREEFHREYAGEIRMEDFCTELSGKRKIPCCTLKEHMQKSQSKKPHRNIRL